MKTKKIIVIGAGFAGLSVAALLGKAGFEVLVLEKNDQVGGRARIWKRDGFTFDMGPSWYLMPEVFERYFGLFNHKPEDFYTLKRLDPSYRIFFGNNETIDIRTELKINKKIFAQLEPQGDKKLDKYLALSAYQYQAAMAKFIYRDYRSVLDFLDWELLTKAPRMKLFNSLHSLVASYFTNQKLQKILEYSTVFLGSSPYNTPALYALMSHIDFNLGVWYPEGGFGMISRALVKLSTQQGVKIYTNHEVSSIHIEKNMANEVVCTNGKTFEADLVVSATDYQHTETQLLPAAYQTYPDSYWQKKVMAPSTFLLFLGLNKKLKTLTHHNLILQADWQQHFDQIFDHPTWPLKPSLYISCPSKTDSTVAPPGKENLFVLIPVAAGLADTPEKREQYSKHIMQLISKTIDEPIEKLISVKRIFAHQDFRDSYHAYQGSALGLAHTLWQTALLRPAHRSKKVNNLFYTGAYTHPGIGVPMVLIASEIVANNIISSYAS